MAITIQSNPGKFTPAFNSIIFRISSDNYAQPDFKFVADVYDGSGNLVATQKYQPAVVGSSPIDIDVFRTVQELVAADYCKFNSVVSPNLVINSGGAVASYSVQFGEQYNGVVHANLTSYSGYIFNGSIPNIRFAFFQASDYLNKKFLTTLSRQVVRKRDSAMLSILQSDTTAITGFDVEIFDLAGNSIYTGNIENPLTSLSATNNRLLHVHCGFDYLYAQMGFNSTVYAQAAYYVISTSPGASMRFDLYSLCERFPGVRLYFLNDLGGFDAFNFMLPDRWSQSNEKKVYQRQPLDKRSSYDPTNKRFEATVRSYYTRYVNKVKLTSDYLTDQEAQLLLQLVPSPLVYMEIDATEYGGTGLSLLPVDVKMTDYEVKKTRLDKLFTVEINIEITQPNFRQAV
ncbi:hypothetical protein [Chitinophaga cymbidii]|uniref:Uncharacterized protein n=1 Tax=Chitinophaga cymbidii TaxID=1096750 RepID=A0A512RIQ9_9BACT|nr:hypothetical protein [Chitinophaga cymbidii]GEP95562.1 hypothetical protein CCY01nite_18220 [Chitinophaga cymbidii]